jgi:hypothetical protein
MSMAISEITQTTAVPQSTPAPARKPDQSSARPPATDSVHLSQAAQAAAATLQEARETSAQTAREAGHGDLQAQRVLARQAAEHAE